MIYGKRKNGGEHGTVFTKPEIVEFMLDIAGLKSAEDLVSKLTIDPSVGEGAFALGLTRRIISLLGDDPDAVGRALRNLTVVELDPVKIVTFVSSLKKILFETSPLLYDHWKYVSIINSDYLTADTGRYDVVIGNPPYVRYDKIPRDSINRYRSLFPCFKARSDLYIAFFEKAIKSLKHNGTLVFICADRWLTNGYGATLRKLIARNFHLSSVIKLSGFSPFAENVAAYPAIFSIKNEAPGSTRYFRAKTMHELTLTMFHHHTDSAVLDTEGELRLHAETPGHISIEEQGFKIGIGVATGADKVFIVRKADCTIEDEVLLPLITRDDTEGDRIHWTDRYVINPFIGDSQTLVDLSTMPRLARYLNSHRIELERRYVARRDPEKWYRTIDRVYPSLVGKPKLLIPDISSEQAIVLDEGNYYPHHNFFYIVGSGIKDLAVLRALLSTESVRRQVAEKGVVMNGGSLRWQAQTLRKLRLPDIRGMTEAEKTSLIAAYMERDYSRIERLARLYAA